jgi:hypothetical protein
MLVVGIVIDCAGASGGDVVKTDGSAGGNGGDGSKALFAIFFEALEGI